ncbi:MAG: dTMP kinase [Gammaproteobacteria bacterium]|nr:dTMP kinase [Gammaproteobacteria bacterium]
MNKERGMFIVIEGGEGVGKSTNLEFIRAQLEKSAIHVLSTREPGGTPLGERLRSILIERDSVPISAKAEALLIFAARMQHLEDVILPGLERGEWVLCDRFTDASYAYQGGGRGLGGERINALEQWTHADVQPDYVIVLDAPAEVGLQRVHQRGSKDRFEQEELEFFERVREVYLTRADGNPERYSVIDASQPLEQVQKQLLEVINELLKSLKK